MRYVEKPNATKTPPNELSKKISPNTLSVWGMQEPRFELGGRDKMFGFVWLGIFTNSNFKPKTLFCNNLFKHTIYVTLLSSNNFFLILFFKCHLYLYILRVIKQPTAQSPMAHRANGRPDPLLLRPIGSPLAQWVRLWASFYAHGYPMGQPNSPTRCLARWPSPLAHPNNS